MKLTEPIMDRTAILNLLAERISAKSYLEIGIDDGHNFVNINVEKKVGVDPSWQFKDTTHRVPSNTFFITNEESFDLIFIDGLHDKWQVYTDIMNSIDVLNEGGIIMCHDINPSKEKRQEVPRKQMTWNGDCWKAWVYLRTKLPYRMYVIDKDQGCGIIDPFYKQEILDLVLKDGLNSDILNWDGLVANRKNWLNLKPGEIVHDWRNLR